jgi:hypothetical protein
VAACVALADKFFLKKTQVPRAGVEIKDDGGLIVLETVNALRIRTINVT